MARLLSNKLNSLTCSCLTFLKKMDMFGVPVKLNFHGEQKFTTYFGAVISLVVYACILQFSYTHLEYMINRKGTVFNNGKEIIDVSDPFFANSIDKLMKKYFPNSFDAPIHEIGKSEFYFAFTGANSLGVSLLDPTYFNISVYQVNNYISEPAGSVVKQEIVNFPLINCGDRFRQKISSPVFENLSLSKLICTDTTDYSIGGNLESLMFEKSKF